MSVHSHCFVEWKEQFVSQERGNRVVHYFLKDSVGESILAIVGTERSIRHMFYVVADEFVRVYGAESSIHAGFKWRSRREVVDWLTSMLSKQHVGDQSKSLEHDAAQALVSLDCPTNGINAQQNHLRVDMAHLSRNVNGQGSDIVWSGIAWTCGKQLKHYPAFCRNGTTIAVRSFVFVMAKGHHHYLAYLEDMYEDKRGQKKVKVRWFHHNQEVMGVVPLRNPHPKEVFITPYVQVISAECVDGPATVLTCEHYEKSVATFPHASLAKIHMCSRQFRSNRVKPFDLSKLRGYFDQTIFSCLDPCHFSRHESRCHGLTGEEEEELSPCDSFKVGAKRARSGKACQQFVKDHSGVSILGKGCKIMTYEPPYHSLQFGLSGSRVLSLKHVDYKPWCALYKVDEKIELLCQDSGIRGCWFRCTVLQVSRKQIKVQYDDLHEEDGFGNLEEWVPAFRTAVPDKLGMRCSGRSIIRPAPPPKDQTDFALEVGAAVDAWWSDGWWEGVVSGIDEFGDDTLQIYFPGENLFLNINKRDLRISRDWVGEQWIDIVPKPDVFSAISAVIMADTKVSMSSAIAKDTISDDFAMPIEVPTSTKLNVEEEKLDLTALASSDDLPHDKNPPLLKDKATKDGAELNDSHDNIEDYVKDADKHGSEEE